MVAKSQGISAAAQKLNLGQPALSTQIKTFENSLNIKLFERSGRKLVLTKHGRTIYLKASQMFEIAQDIRKVPENTIENQKIIICVGVSNEIERPYCVELVKNILKLHPAPKAPLISFVSDKGPVMIERLLNGEIDAVVTNSHISKEGLSIVDVLNLPVTLAIHKSFVKTRDLRKFIKKKEIFELIGNIGLGFAMPTPELKLRLEVDDFLSRAHFKPEVVYESDTLGTVVRAVKDKVGVSLLPKDYFVRDTHSGNIISLGPNEGFWKHHIYLIIRSKSQSLEKIKMISQAFKKLDKY